MPSGNKTLGFGVMRGTCTLSYSAAGLCRGGGGCVAAAASTCSQPPVADAADMAVSGCLPAVIF